MTFVFLTLPNYIIIGVIDFYFKLQIMPRNSCYFNDEWTNPELYPEFNWLAKHSLRQGRCRMCRGGTAIIDVANMGIQALRRHAETPTHKKAMLVPIQFNSINTYYSNPNKTKVKNVPEVNNNTNINVAHKVSKDNINPKVSNVNLEIEEISSSTGSAVAPVQNFPNTSVQNVTVTQAVSMTSYITTSDVTRAEILYSLCQIRKHASLRCFSELSDCFPIMFSDSGIAKKFRMHKDKLSYSITYGLGPYFQSELARTIRMTDYFAISFDESTNKVAQKGQMDLVVRFWTHDRIETRYLTSCFLLDATAVGLLEGFKQSLNDLNINLHKIIQVSMDGPNVNLKFLNDLNTHLDTSPERVKLIEIGTCSLHIVNNSFKNGVKISNWNIDGFLKSIYYLFKDFPVRRGTFIRVTESCQFPLKFCSIRWTENADVMSRAKSLVPTLRDYVQKVHKKPPNTKNYGIAAEFLKDKFLEAKLAFLISVCFELERFLTIYQSNDPLLPFLYNDVYNLMKDLLARILKSEVLKEIKTPKDLLSVDLEKKDNLCLPSRVDIGVGAVKALKSIKNAKDSEIMAYKIACQKIILEICKNLKLKCPLKYGFVRGASCLSPIVMLNQSIAKIRVQKALEVLNDQNHIDDITCEKIKADYLRFISDPKIIKELESYDRKKQRLDTFYMELLRTYQYPKQLIDFFKRILIAFHGNAAVERSFSFNKDFLVENLQEHSLVAQRSVHDFLLQYKNVKDVEITKEMITAFKNSSQERLKALKEKNNNEDVAKKRKRELSDEIQALRARKTEASETINSCQQAIDSYERELKKLEDKLKI